MNQSILITRKLDDKIVTALAQKYHIDMWEEAEIAMPRAELLRRIKGKVGLLCMLTDGIDQELLDAAGEQLRTVSTLSVGFDHIEIAAIKARGITLGYTPGVLSEAVADITIALMLNAGRRIAEAERAVKEGNWSTWSPYWMTGHDLSGATVGLVGMGSIAAVVAKRLGGFNCKVLYTSRSAKPELEESLGVGYKELEDLLKESDFISIHAPLTEQTKEMCNAKFFSQMKSSAIFVNTSRGGLVDQRDLYTALSTNQIYAAGLDVVSPEPLPVSDPLLTLPNCIVLPHIGSASINTRMKMSQIAAENLIAGIEGKPLVSQVV